MTHELTMAAFTDATESRSQVSRAHLALERTSLAWAKMSGCNFCAYRCGANRRAGARGPCGAGPAPRVFSLQTEVSDEIELAPTFSIAFSGCDLRCPFCITAPSSWHGELGRQVSPEAIAGAAILALRNGARTIMFLGGEPTLHLPEVLSIVALLPDSARLVWKTNGRGSGEARMLLDGLFNVWVVDFKFGNPECAARLVGVPDYAEAIYENLLWARGHSDLIVRHLIMPGHVECCWRPIAAWLAENLPGTKVNLRAGFWPAKQPTPNHELSRLVSAEEARQAQQIAEQNHLHLIS
jgi:putative pyruvate formate lyase activating enzyme